MNNRSLPNKILLFVFPLIYLLMLVAMVGFGILYLRDSPVRLFAVGAFSLYLLYRLFNRTRILIREVFWPGEGEDTDPVERSSGNKPDGA